MARVGRRGAEAGGWGWRRVQLPDAWVFLRIALVQLLLTVILALMSAFEGVDDDVLTVGWGLLGGLFGTVWYGANVATFALIVRHDSISGGSGGEAEGPLHGSNYALFAVSLLFSTVLATASIWTAFFASDREQNGATYFVGVPADLTVLHFFLHMVGESLSVLLTPGTVLITPSSLWTLAVYNVHALLTIFFLMGFSAQWLLARNAKGLAAAAAAAAGAGGGARHATL